MPNAYLDSYRVIGNREDLINLITNISYDETVFMSRIGKKSAKNRLHEWLTETLQSSNSGNAIVEGSSATFASTDSTVRSRLTNVTQILRKPFSSSYTQEEIEGAGVTSEFDHQRELKTKELARDMNSALLNQSSATGDSTTARTMHGALAAIATNTATANGLPLEQSTYNQIMQAIWTAGGRPNATYVHGFNKRTISTWTAPLNRNIDASGKKLVVSVDSYDSDFGMQMILLEREMPTSQVLIAEEKYWNATFLRPLFFEELGKVGEQRRGSVVSELTLEYLAENSSGKITGTATS